MLWRKEDVCASYKVSDVVKKVTCASPNRNSRPNSPYWSWDRHVHLQSAFISVVYNGLRSLFTPAIRERSSFSMVDCWHRHLGRFFVLVRFLDRCIPIWSPGLGLEHPIVQARMTRLVNGPLKTPLGSTSRCNFCSLSYNCQRYVRPTNLAEVIEAL